MIIIVIIILIKGQVKECSNESNGISHLKYFLYC